MKAKDNRKILVVDDETSIHEDFKKILGELSQEDEQFDEKASKIFEDENKKDEEKNTSEKYELGFAKEGEEAVKMVEEAANNKSPYSLVFIDFRMPPGINGVETIVKIWEKYPQTEMVLVTAFSDYSIDQIVELIGKTSHFLLLRKPFDPQEIQQLALTLTTKWNLEKRLEKSLKILRRDRILISVCIILFCLFAIYIMYGSLF